jgi:mitogen-activated protein kinase kinase kinase kinase 4
MTIDERLEALTMNLELVSRNQEAMQARQEAMQANQEAMQARQEAMQAMQEAMQVNQEAMQGTQADILNDLEKMQSEIRIVLGSQVVMSDALTKLADAQSRSELRMDALILIVDQVIRGGSKPQ